MKKTNIFILLIVIFLVYIIIYNLISRDSVYVTKTYDLEKDGTSIFNKVISDMEIEKLKQYCKENNYKEVKNKLIHNSKLNNVIRQKLGKDYQFQDYIWIIKKSSVHTCHRDNNGDFFNEGQKYPSYTLIVYLEDMEKCLGIIPKSHKSLSHNNINLTNKVESLLCKSGDAILFNANLIHVGTIQKKNDHLRIQMKITHKDDIPFLSYYEDFNKVLKKDNNIPKSVLHFQRNVSCMFPFISDLTQSENISSSRGSDNGVKVSTSQKMFSYLFYGNSEFYDLPNAF
jgi:hypothetical protein